MKIAAILVVCILSAVVVAGVVFFGEKPLPSGLQADRVPVEKKARKMALFSKGKPIKTYKIALGRCPEGPKTRQGDNKTPEGTYLIDSRNPNSSFQLALHISYPNLSDVRRSKKLGANPGGDIMIHGLTNGSGWIGRLHRISDWTAGCIAVTDSEIEEIWRITPNGIPTEILP